MAQQPKLSEKQEKALRYIQHYGQEHSRPPSYRELETAIGASSVSVVSYHIGKLEDMALLTREKHVARSLRLTDKALAFLGLVRDTVQHAAGVVTFTIAGDIVAGQPVEPGNDGFATYDEDETITVDAGLLPRRKDNLFALRVRGNSMIDALIRDRDVVILEPATSVRDGDMVAAWLRLEQELTLKHYFLEGDRVRLQPANPTMDPIYAPAANVDVQARVVSVFRQDASQPTR